MQHIPTRQSPIILGSIEALLQAISKISQPVEHIRKHNMSSAVVQSNEWHRTRLAAATQNDFWVQIVGLRNGAKIR